MKMFYSMHDVLDFGKYRGKTLLQVFLKDQDYLQHCLEKKVDFHISPSSIKEMLEKFPGNAVLAYAEQKTEQKIRLIIREQFGAMQFFKFPEHFTEKELAEVHEKYGGIDFLYHPN